MKQKGRPKAKGRRMKQNGGERSKRDTALDHATFWRGGASEAAWEHNHEAERTRKNKREWRLGFCSPRRKALNPRDWVPVGLGGQREYKYPKHYALNPISSALVAFNLCISDTLECP